MSLLEHVTNALTRYDMEHFGDIGDLEQYEELAEAAIKAYEEFATTPRQPVHFIEGLVFL